jgi:transcriptional regulator with XRE-family HTH domain
MTITMPRPSKLKLPPLDLGGETFGERLARIRKERGYTQVELAEKVGLIQALISDYEHNKLRLHAEMVVRIAQGLGVSADMLLGLRNGKNGTGHSRPPRRRVLRRLEQIERLPEPQQRALLKTIDAYVRGVQRP